MDWQPEALAELEKIPQHVRHMAKSSIEKQARELGLGRVDQATVLKIKKKYFGLVEKDEKAINVAIVRCDIVSETCPGSGCLKAFNKRKIHFEQYGPEANLVGFFTCGGCSGRRVARLVEKLNNNSDLDVVHLSSCMLFEGDYPKCPFKNAIKNSIEVKGIKVVEGTHH